VSFSPLTLRLALFTGVTLVIANAVLAWLGQPTALHDTKLFLHGVQGVDSWRPMNQAYAIASAEGAAQPLYQRLFFEGRVKFVYPPTALLLFRALDGTLPPRAWPAALNLLSWLCVAATIAASAWLLDRVLARAAPAASRADRAARVLLATLFGVGFYPLIKAYTLGQMQVLVNACFALFLCCWWLGWRAAAGVLVASMAAVKPQYGLLAVWGLVRRDWRFAGSATLAGLVLLGLSSLAFGFGDHLDYLRVVAHVGRHGEAYWPNQSVNGLLQRLLHNAASGVWDPHVYPPFHPAVYAGTLVSSLALLAAGLWWPPRAHRSGDALDLAGFALALTMASPLAWEHHYGVLLPILPIALGAVLARTGDARATAAWWLAACAAIASQYWHALGALSGTVWNPLQSLLLFTSLALLALLLSSRIRVEWPADISARKGTQWRS
jgi:hypothetical protein